MITIGTRRWQVLTQHPKVEVTGHLVSGTPVHPDSVNTEAVGEDPFMVTLIIDREQMQQLVDESDEFPWEVRDQ